MKRFDKNEFDFNENLGKSFWFVEEVTNDNNEDSVELYLCENEEESIKECEWYNKHNQDKRNKFIVINYTVTENGLECI